MTGGAESCINLEKKVRVNIVNFSAGKKDISYVIIIIATLWALLLRQHCTGPLGTREGQKGRELISVSIFHVSITLLHTLVTISLNLITTLPGKWCYPHVYMTDSCLSHKNNSNDLIGVVIIIMFKLWCIFFFFLV